MSMALYDSLLEKWIDFLNDNEDLYCYSLMPEEWVEEQYDFLVTNFCKKYNYKEKTENMAFYDLWWDTFVDEYYQKLEDEGLKIIHENPVKDDWDYGKKFEVDKTGLYKVCV